MFMIMKLMKMFVSRQCMYLLTLLHGMQGMGLLKVLTQKMMKNISTPR